LAVFAGFNHFKGVVIFGVALLYDETSASFEWLFREFLKAHKNKKPQTLFTDQDPAMAKVIPNNISGVPSLQPLHFVPNIHGYGLKVISVAASMFLTCSINKSLCLNISS